MDNKSKIITYLLITICIALPFLIVFLSRHIVKVSLERSGRGIDGIGAALLTVAVVRILQISGYVTYLALWAYSTFRIFKLDMPKWVIAIPVVPVAVTAVMYMVHSKKIKQA